MTLDRIRAIALALPDTSESDAAFHVAGELFAEVRGTTLSFRTPGGKEAIELTDDTDWTLVEDQVARSWELAAPAGVLEAGGR